MNESARQVDSLVAFWRLCDQLLATRNHPPGTWVTKGDEFYLNALSAGGPELLGRMKKFAEWNGFEVEIDGKALRARRPTQRGGLTPTAQRPVERTGVRPA